MINPKILSAFEKLYNEEYYTSKELEYSNKVGLFLSPYEYKVLLDYKDDAALNNHPYFNLLPLKTFNYKCIYYSLGADLSSLISEYLYLADDNNDLFTHFSSDFITSRIYSEIEGSLNVENVPTTRRRLKELLEEGMEAKDQNDIIIQNMKKGIDFVSSLPEFNKDNLFKLYTLLSSGCLNKDDELHDGDYYRYDSVDVSRYHGCPYDKIDEMMNSLFAFVNESLKSEDIKELILLPHICHYYLIYIHPYFNYNGRTARMVSYWVYLLSGLNVFPPIISDAINQTKAQYYKAIELSRDAHNDLTYFLSYLLKVSIDYILCYQNLAHFELLSKNKGFILTETELAYLKKMLISYNGVFNYQDFIKTINVSMSKQGALKTLNHFEKYGIIKVVESESKSKIFDFNIDNVPYSLKTIGYK